MDSQGSPVGKTTITKPKPEEEGAKLQDSEFWNLKWLQIHNHQNCSPVRSTNVWASAIKHKAALAWVAQLVKSFKEERKVFIQMAHGKQAIGQCELEPLLLPWTEINPRSREKCLLCQPEALSSDPQHPWEKTSGGTWGDGSTG